MDLPEALRFRAMNDEAAKRWEYPQLESEFERGFLLGNRQGEEFGREQERAATVKRIRAALVHRAIGRRLLPSEITAILDAEAQT